MKWLNDLLWRWKLRKIEREVRRDFPAPIMPDKGSWERLMVANVGDVVKVNPASWGKSAGYFTLMRSCDEEAKFARTNKGWKRVA